MRVNESPPTVDHIIVPKKLIILYKFISSDLSF